MARTRSAGRREPGYASLAWWQLLFTYLRDSQTMLSNPLLERAIRQRPGLPKWRLQVGSLWLFPLVAVSAILLAAASMGQSGGLSTAVGVSFAAVLCVYPPYLLGGGMAFIIPARVAPVLSSEVQAGTLDALRLTNLSSAEIALGKLLAALLPFAGLLGNMATFFVLIAILGGLGTGAVPAVLGLPPGETLAVVVLLEVPVVFGPLVNVVFASALSLTVSSYTSRPGASIGAAYGTMLLYWVLTGLALSVILLLLSKTFVPGSPLLEMYTTSPAAFLYPNALRLALSAALTPLLIHAAIARIERR